MSYYVELLRAKRALIVAAIILGILIVTSIIVRVSIGGNHFHTWQDDLSSSPTAHVTTSTLADGSQRTVIDDPQQRKHGTFVRHPDGSMNMDVVERAGDVRHNHAAFGNFSMNEQNLPGGMRHITARFDRVDLRFDIGVMFLITIPLSLVVATILGGVLAKENDGHLDLAWTKPFSREQYAISAFAIDSLAIVATSIMTIAAGLICVLLFVVPAFKTTPDLVWEILLAFAGPIAWYAVLTAASASIKRGPGLVCGLGWVVAIIIPAVSGILESPAKINNVANAFYRIFDALTYIDPLTYFSFKYSHGIMHSATGLTVAGSLGVVALLAVGYLAISVVQWRRVEA